MGLKETIKQLWTKKIEKEYAKLLSQKKISYHDWVKAQEKEVQTSKGDIEAFREEYVLFLQKKGKVTEKAEAWMAEYIATHPQVQILYGDEDFLTAQGIRENPWYKPCWSPDTYLSQFYVGSVIAVKKNLIADRQDRKIYFEDPEEIRPLLTECMRQAGGFLKGCQSIAGCEKILFHVTDELVWEKYQASSEGRNVSEREGTADFSDISVIIPSKDNPAVLEKCLKALRACVNISGEASDEPWKTSGLEVIVVDNGSSEENKKQVETLTQGMKYIYRPMEFNFSKMCNIGVEAATGKYLLFLNDDIEVCGRKWLCAMKAKAALPYVGAVGLKLYYPDSRRMQHAGITNLPVGPVHKMQFTEDNRSYYFDRNKADMNCLAVTAACLLMDKGKYLEVGGLKESLRVAYNDVELGFALYEAGYQNVVINTQFAYHHESLSRGSDESREKQARLQKEREHLYEMHPALKGRDPYYPDLLHKDGPDVRIVPGYINALNTLQEAALEEMCFEAEQIRVDNCLMPGIEVSEKSVIKGYSVVLGDNNACYDRYIVLAEEMTEEEVPEKTAAEGVLAEAVSAGKTVAKKLKKSADETANLKTAWIMKTEPQYRQDLEENIPDQKNVALCGFHVHIPESESRKLVKDARYIVGVLAVHKINKGKLLNWSSRYYINE